MPDPKPTSIARVLTSIAALLLGFFLILGLAIFTLFRNIRNSPATAAALAAAGRYPQVTDITGLPLIPGRIVSGSIHHQGPDSDATLTIPVHGPLGKGTLYVVEATQNGIWTQQTLEFWPASNPNNAIRLLEPHTANRAP